MLSSLLVCSALLSAPAQAQAVHPASAYVADVMTKGKKIVEQDNSQARVRGLCNLMKSNLAKASIGQTWLGEFSKLERERKATQQFMNLVPSIIVTQAVQAMGEKAATGGSFAVNPKADQRAQNVFDVGVTVSADGSSYSFKAIVFSDGGKKFRLYDLEYMGFSAVNYLGRDYQQTMNEEYRRDPAKSMPVSFLIQQILGQDNFVRCP